MGREPTPFELEAIDRLTREFDAIRQRFQLEGRRSESTRSGWGGLRSQHEHAAAAAAAPGWPTLVLLYVDRDGVQAGESPCVIDAGEPLIQLNAARSTGVPGAGDHALAGPPQEG